MSWNKYFKLLNCYIFDILYGIGCFNYFYLYFYNRKIKVLLNLSKDIYFETKEILLE